MINHWKSRNSVATWRPSRRPYSPSTILPCASSSAPFSSSGTANLVHSATHGSASKLVNFAKIAFVASGSAPPPISSFTLRLPRAFGVAWIFEGIHIRSGRSRRIGLALRHRNRTFKRKCPCDRRRTSHTSGPQQFSPGGLDFAYPGRSHGSVRAHFLPRLQSSSAFFILHLPPPDWIKPSLPRSSRKTRAVSY